MLIDKYLASIASYVFKAGNADGNLTAYFHEIPENGKLPAIYFPDPSVISSRDTLSGFELEYSWYIKIFAVSEEIAYQIASEIQRELSLNRYKIPVLSEDGTKDGFNITINSAEIKSIEAHTFQLSLDWKEYNHYRTPESTAIDDVYIDVRNKHTQYSIIITEDGSVLTDENGDILISSGG